MIFCFEWSNLENKHKKGISLYGISVSDKEKHRLYPPVN